MSDRSDYPRCETCEHWDTLDKRTQSVTLEEPYGRCWKYISGLDNGGDRHTKPDFGCIRHSDLSADKP